MRRVRFVALGDSLTEGVGDPVGEGWRGWAALLASGLVAPGFVAESEGAAARTAGPEGAEEAEGAERAEGVTVAGGAVATGGAVVAGGAVEFVNLAVSGAQTRDVLERQLAVGLELRPDVVSVVVGVNDTLRCTFDIQAVAARLDTVYGAFAEQGAVLLTACLPDPGGTLGLPGALARPLARRQRAVNAVVHALSQRYGAVHLHAAEGAWLTDRAMWSADRLHPGERGHRQLAVRFHAVLAEAGVATGPAPSPEPEFPAPTTSASLWWLATAGTGWVARRCTDLLPQLLTLAADELRHRARGTSARLDLRASAAVSAALTALSAAERRPDAA
ncbi:SGNH/GDSL hydrolase family protein [Streptomyces maremycinicus]|uniref:SGNH/GDSL hydrolase family protein n=1 Tax=Streptomyces maremycinicus TaxID=1679753 RepID=UPI0007890B86|nr:SGNH/GDSL hydrolase family protein [Streptomyces sp. NBRC 110468]